MSPEVIAAKAVELGMNAVALTDTSNMFGAVAFHKACTDAGIKPILGAELTVQPEGIEYEDPRGIDGGYQIIALVRNDLGYKNLSELVTRGIFEGMSYKPRIDLSKLSRHCEGLFFLTGGLTGVFGVANAGDEIESTASVRLDALCEVLSKEQIFVELVDVAIEGQDQMNSVARSEAKRLGLRTVVTNSVHYASPEDAPVLEVLNAIAEGGTISDESRRVQSPTDQAYFKSEEELRELFPDDDEAFANTVEIASACDYHFPETYHFPSTTPPDIEGDEHLDTDRNWRFFLEMFSPPASFVPGEDVLLEIEQAKGGGTLGGYFKWYARRGLEVRLAKDKPPESTVYWDRLELELDIIIDMGFPAYLLMVADFINWSKENSIPVGPGRGSAAGSLVAYAMRITDIDPIRFTLLFERFLNPARVSMPDIDIDFCQDRREEVIEYARDKYGYDYVSQIITYGTLKAKAAVRDVARVLGLSFHEADRLSKLIPDDLGIKIKDAIEQVELLQHLQERDPKIRRVLHLAQKIEGLCRQTSVHAAGVVIADRPLVEYAPLYRDEPEGGPVVQYDMKSAEAIGLIKFDFLGLKTLDQIRDTVGFVKLNHGVDVDMTSLPWDDADTYKLLQNGDTLGVFQLESSGMRDLLVRLEPSTIDDVVALVALYRPGPLTSGMTDDFVERKHGRRKVKYPLPQLEPILESTYGTIVYQEQVMQVAQVMAGYSLGEADLLRRAMGKKKKSEMDKQQDRFVRGSVENGINKNKAVEIFELLAKFAAYGFNKSHSAAYGFIAYQTAWLKAHYRPELMAALMTSEAANSDKLLLYIEDCKRVGISILPPCVNRSQPHFTAIHRPEGAAIRFGMSAVKNVGTGAVEAIIHARESIGGEFESAADFFENVDFKRVNKRVVEGLAKAGAFDVIEKNRAAILADLSSAISHGVRHQEDKAAGQVLLFQALSADNSGTGFGLRDAQNLSTKEMLDLEFDAVGFYLSGHPMDLRSKEVRKFATAPISRLGGVEPGAKVRIIGVPGLIRTSQTRRGEKMAFVRLEEGAGAIECVFFADIWSNSKKAMKTKQPILVSGKIEDRKGERQIRVASVETLDDVRARSVKGISFHLTSDELSGDRLFRFKELLKSMDGKCETNLVLKVNSELQAQLLLPYTIEPSLALEDKVEGMFQRSNVVVIW